MLAEEVSRKGAKDAKAELGYFFASFASLRET